MKVVYEDNHLLIVSKAVGEIVQGDKTGDEPLVDTLKRYLKVKYNKPGNVFLGLTHRLDRPVAGLVIFAKTSKALSRVNKMIKDGKLEKTYRAIVEKLPPKPSDTLTDFLLKNEKQNKSYVVQPGSKKAKEAKLSYRLLAKGRNYHLLEVDLHTGRHHQIRCQLANMGCIIKGDLKYGAKRSNKDGGISLLAYKLRFEHPVTHEILTVYADLEGVDPLFGELSQDID